MSEMSAAAGLLRDASLSDPYRFSLHRPLCIAAGSAALAAIPVSRGPVPIFVVHCTAVLLRFRSLY